MAPSKGFGFERRQVENWSSEELHGCLYRLGSFLRMSLKQEPYITAVGVHFRPLIVGSFLQVPCRGSRRKLHDLKRLSGLGRRCHGSDSSIHAAMPNQKNSKVLGPAQHDVHAGILLTHPGFGAML